MNIAVARIAGLTGWRRWALAWGLGAGAVAAMPPLSFTPILLLSFVGLVWLLDGAGSWLGAARDGWWFGFGFFFAGLYWIANALLTDAASFGWLVPFAVLVLPAILAVFTAIGTVTAKFLWVPGWGRILSLAVGWAVGEMLRGSLFTGFPWILMGYTWTWSLPVLQTVSVTGIYGLSFMTAFIAASPAALVGPGSQVRGGLGPMMFSGSLLAALFVGGSLRLASADVETVSGVTLRIVQPNIAQTEKWDPELRERNLSQILELSTASATISPTHIVWPETAATFFLGKNAAARARLSQAVPLGGLLLTGAPRGEFSAGGTLARIWNSLQIIDESGDIVQTYDKSHLVPFGEYVPFRDVLEDFIGLGPVVPGSIDYSAGTGPKTLVLPGLPPLSPLVCYEVIFPGGVVDPDNRPAWILNITNDAWYGRSAGPFQHFAMARVRAVEQGLPLVRAANTGISGAFDPLGRVLDQLRLDEAGFLDVSLPLALAQTPFARWGPRIPIALILATALGVYLFGRPRSN